MGRKSEMGGEEERGGGGRERGAFKRVVKKEKGFGVENNFEKGLGVSLCLLRFWEGFTPK